MSKPTTREAEPLYIITFHNNNAEQKLQSWCKNNPKANMQVQGMRMRVYDQQSLSLFQLSWTNGWETIVIWDNWNRRLIYLN